MRNTQQIARDWNAKDPLKKAGYVTKFHVKTAFLARYEVRAVEERIHQEYWIPAGELAEFNANIVGLIEVVSEFRLNEAAG
jgi:hypothetical protein